MTQQETQLLIEKAQAGDINSANAVVFAYRPLAKSIAHSYFFEGADAEDVLQVGMIGLFRAIQTYDCKKSASFKTYAICCIRNMIIDEIRKNKSSDVEVVAIDDYEQSLPTNSDDPELCFIEKESAKILQDDITKILKPIEADVLQLHLESLSYEEIAKKLGIERKKVDNTLYNAKKKLKTFISENGTE